MAGSGAAFKALADENRMLILRLLLRRNCCVRALSRQLDISEAAVSQHLKVLREAGLILGEKSGYFTHYTVNRPALQALSDMLSEMARAAECVPCTPLHGGCSAAEFEKCRNAALTAQAGIELVPGASGSADAAVQSLLNGTLVFNPDTVCTHHHHGEGHDCGSHSCGAHKNGCAGNH